MAATGRFSFQLGQPLFAQDDHVLNGFCLAFEARPDPEAKAKVGTPDRREAAARLRISWVTATLFSLN
jgi:hypothetical protein